MSRQYDFVLFGATGFTGVFAAEHVTTHLPTDVKWALAGRSRSKLQALADDLRKLNPDRLPPSIEECSLESIQLDALAKKTRVLCTTVGPYAKYGTPVVEACVNNGTHYFDITGETPWVYDIIAKYHDKARANKAIVIPQIGMDSAPADLTSWLLVTHIRNTLKAPTDKVIFSLHRVRAAASGGTLASLLGLFDFYSLAAIRKAIQPFALSPAPPSKPSPGPAFMSLTSKLTGVKTVADLGTLTTSLQGSVDRTQVYRSRGLIDNGEYYGPHFRFYPFMRARNFLQGLIIHLALAVGGLSLIFAPIRNLLRRFVYAPGTGPGRETSQHDYIHYRAIGEADIQDSSAPKRALAKFEFDGGAYHISGILMTEAAICLLRDDSLAKSLGGGVLTPATLGEAYVERLKKAGIRIEVSTMP